MKLFASAHISQRVGEASPSYLWHPEAAARIHAKRADAKIIALVRHPIARAYSQYRMDLADGLPPISFNELVRREYARGDQVYGTGHLYVELGLYAEALTRYVTYFSAERVLVLSFQELADQRKLLQRVAAFLEIDMSGFGDMDALAVYNQNVAPRNAAIAEMLRLRALRRLYRAWVPTRVRNLLRERAFVMPAQNALEPAAVEFLREIYLPDWRSVREHFGDLYELECQV